MTLKTALLATLLAIGGPLLAQTQPSATPPAKPPAHQPGVPAHPAGTTPSQSQSGSGTEKVDPAKDQAIRHLMDLTQTSKMAQDLNAYVTKQVHDAMSQALPAEKLAKFMQTFAEKLDSAAPASAITDSTVSIYAQAFSMEDIQGLIQFYESPLGQRVVKQLPHVAQESQRVGVQMEQKAALTTLQDMSGEYPELKSLLEPPQGAPETPGTAKPPAAGTRPPEPAK